MMHFRKEKQYFAFPKKEAIKEIKKMSQVCKVQEKKEKVIVHTKRIRPVIKYKDSIEILYDIGTFKITLSEHIKIDNKIVCLTPYILRKEGIIVASDSDKSEVESYTPHTFAYGRCKDGSMNICFGAQTDILTDAKYNKDYYGCIQLLLSFISDGDYIHEEYMSVMTFMYHAQVQMALIDKKYNIARKLVKIFKNELDNNTGLYSSYELYDYYKILNIKDKKEREKEWRRKYANLKKE